MFTYIARRLLLLLPVLLGVTLITFALTRIIPGNPIAQLVSPLATPEQRQALAHQHGLDQPLIEQYYTYVKGLAHGDLGTSFTTNQPVREDLTSRFAATFELTFYAMILSMLLGVPLGITAAVWRNGPADHVARVLSVTGIALPVFWTGTTLLYLMFTRWHLVSAPYGRIDPSVDPPHQYTGLYTVDALISGNWTALHSAASALLLPVVVLAFGALAPIARMTRSGLIEALESDYVRAARSLGLPARTVVLRHALANALLPLITIIATVYGYLLGGVVLVENIFAWPGLGRYVYTAITSSDYPSVQGFIIYATTLYVLLFLIVDVLYIVVDPRLRHAREA
jgi:peptide/nickel transport system permease protein